MVGDPLGNMLLGFLSLVSGVVDFGNRFYSITNRMESSTNVTYMRESYPINRFSENIQGNSWSYVSNREYQEYLDKMKQKSGSLILIR